METALFRTSVFGLVWYHMCAKDDTKSIVSGLKMLEKLFQ